MIANARSALREYAPGVVRLLLAAFPLLWVSQAVLADASGTIVYTKRFDDDNVVLEVDWTYVRAAPSLTFGTPRVIWTGTGAPGGAPGSDGLFFNPAGELVVGNHEASSLWKFDPTQTNAVIDGPETDALAFHLLLHPNEEDFLATSAFGQITCGDVACFGVYDHTPLDATTICAAPLESATQDLLQLVTFIADENLNLFAIFSDGRDCAGCPGGSGIQFGGGGFASFDLTDTTSTRCSGAMRMTRLIPQEISAAHSVSWDSFLSNANAPGDPHSDFILFANSRVSHVRVDDPGTPGASAQIVSSVNMSTEGICDSLLPGGTNEFDQGAVTGEGIALVGDEVSGYVALIDYSQNTNGTILDPQNTVCLTALLASGIDDIGPLTGLGALHFYGTPFDINAGHAGAWYNPVTSGQGQFVDVEPASKFMFISWFTYTGADDPDDFEQHWFTAQGNYSGNRANLDLFETLGGQFDDPQDVSTNKVGEVAIKFDDCGQGHLSYHFTDSGLQGGFPMQRVIPGSGDVCEDLDDQAAQAVDINAGMDGSWFDPNTSGQGFFIDAYPNPGGDFIFVSWFTYGDDTASGQRWLTAQGAFAAPVAEIDVYETTGGSFDAPTPTDTVPVGTLSIDFEDCNNAQLSYNLTDDGAQGDIDLTRVIPAAGALCEELAAAR
jgi:hypothetical protein